MIFDLVFLAILIVFLIYGIRKGAAKTLLSLVALVLAAVLSIVLSRCISQWISDFFIRGWLVNRISSVIEATALEPVANTVSEIVSSVPQVIISVLAFKGMSSVGFETSCTEALSDEAYPAEQSIADLIMPAITGVIGAVLGIILFIVLTILLSGLAKALSKVFRLPLIRVLDSLFGAVLGIAEGILLVTVILVLLNLLIPMLPISVSEYINTSYVFEGFNSGELLNLIQQYIYPVKELV
ncbi:MAG: CvpA family protein [Ruminococcus sp.]|nr:CvpA family protein [Ruminococcus sp.]